MDTVRLPSILRKRTDSFVAGVAELRFQRSELDRYGPTALHHKHGTRPQSTLRAMRVNHGYGEPEGQPLTNAYPT